MRYIRLRIPLVVLCLVWSWLFLFCAPARAQDGPPADSSPVTAASPQATQAEITADGYTIWRKDIDSACSYEDHNYTLDIDADPAEMSDIRYTMTNYDVDYGDAQSCEGGPEVDHMRLNGNFLGRLTGADGSWSTNSWPLSRSKIISGSNDISIDTDAPGTGCWCVGVGYIEVRAKLGFKVASFTPQKDDKNRDFHKDKLDLTVTFSTGYDAATLTADTFKLEYRDQGGAWQSLPGTFTPLAPEKFRFVPNGDLKDGVRYRVMIKSGDAGVKATNGNKLDSDTEWYFWTVPDLSLTDSFDYGSGSVCPPATAPCKGVDVVVFQVARNSIMVPNKPAVARLYLRWKKHNDVLDADQLKSLEVDSSITVNGSQTSKRATVKRPDEYGAAERAAAANSININHTPTTAFAYTAEVIPQPQTNATLIKYTGALALPSTVNQSTIKFNYYFLKDGDWAAGTPAGAKSDGRALFTNGVQLMEDVFPILSATYTEQGEQSLGYTRRVTMTDTFASCGTVWQVSCPTGWFFSTNKPEIQCVYDRLETMLGGNRFVAATVPDTLCANVNGMAYRNVFVHFSGSGANYGTIVHETGHILGLDHIDGTNNIEGFQVRTGTNRSNAENPTNLASLMHTVGQPAEKRWIDNTQYATLIGLVPTARLQGPAAAAAGPFLIVSGYIYTATNSAELIPAFLQDLPNSPPAASGLCTIELLNGSDGVLAADHVDLVSDLHITPSDPNAPPIETQVSSPFFSVSLPWDASAQKIRISCNGTPFHVENRSGNAPTVDFVNVSEGATLAGTQVISWTGSDLDGPNLAYQLQLRTAGSDSWTPLIPLGTATQTTLDTTHLPTATGHQLRILVTDGFNTAYATRTINIVNTLTVITTLPSDNATDAETTTTVQAVFASDILTTTLNENTFIVQENGFFIDGRVTYKAASRTAVFTPDQPFKANTTYNAYISSMVADVQGNMPATYYGWTFTTGTETMPPFVVSNHPARDDVNVPINTLVQIRFNEAMAAATLTTDSFQLLDANNVPIAATVTYNPENWTAVLIPAANLQANSAYHVRVGENVTDLVGNPLGTFYQWSFTTGSSETLHGLRIVGNYSERANDTNGDGLYDSLEIFVDVEVRTEAFYNINARLVDQTEKLIEWAGSGAYLLPGVHTLTLLYNSIPIRSNGVDGSYIVDSLNFYDVNTPLIADQRVRAFQTFPYAVEQFYSILALSGLPDQLLEWNTTRSDALNLRNFTVHTLRPVSDVTYSILVNTDPNVGVSIDENANLDIIPPANTEAESDVSIEARDPEGNRVVSTFRISVQKARAAQLQATADPVAPVNQSRSIQVNILDQFGRAFTEPVTLTVATTLGTVEPVNVTTSAASADFTFQAGDTPGVAFVTLQTGSASTIVRIEVVDVAVTAVQIDGPTLGTVNTTYSFTANVAPISTTVPVTIIWSATGQVPIVLPSTSLASTVNFTWHTPGVQEVTVAATNRAGTVVQNHTINITDPGVPTGVISGHIFMDLNGNGVQENGESNLEGIQVIVTPKARSEPIIGFTDMRGNYAIPAPIGEYIVSFGLRGYTTINSASFAINLTTAGVINPSIAVVVKLHLPLITR